MEGLRIESMELNGAMHYLMAENVELGLMEMVTSLILLYHTHPSSKIHE